MPEIAVPTPQNIDQSHFTRPKPLLRNLLRDATAADHRRLDGRLAALQLKSMAGYRRFLEINAAALLPLESALVAAGVRDVVPVWSLHARTEAILSDLKKLGGRIRPLQAPMLCDPFAVLGTLYVLEGSRLGAAYLLKTVKNASDPMVAGTTAYLGHGAGQHLWASFLSILESHAEELIDEDDLVHPARRAFDLFATAANLP